MQTFIMFNIKSRTLAYVPPYVERYIKKITPVLHGNIRSYQFSINEHGHLFSIVEISASTDLSRYDFSNCTIFNASLCGDYYLITYRYT
jgi:hypothetical protein